MLKVRVDLSGLQRKIAAAAGQLPFATALALTRTAQAVKADQVTAMRSSFKAPTTFTLNSLSVDKATKQQLVATVGVRGEDTGAGAIRWLRPEVYGGGRSHAIEALLRPLGLPPKGMYAVPSGAAKTRASGGIDINWYRSLIADMTSQGISAAGSLSRGSKATRRKRGDAPGGLQYFVLLQPWGKLGPGIFARRGRRLFPLIAFVPQPMYRARFDFYGIAQRTAQQRFPEEFRKAVDVALATAR